MSKRPSLSAALNEASGKTQPEVKTESELESGKLLTVTTSVIPPSRQGKKAITGHFDPAVSRQLKQIALDNGTSIQALLAEAMNDLFVKHKRNPIA